MASLLPSVNEKYSAHNHSQKTVISPKTVATVGHLGYIAETPGVYHVFDQQKTVNNGLSTSFDIVGKVIDASHITVSIALPSGIGDGTTQALNSPGVFSFIDTIQVTINTKTYQSYSSNDLYCYNYLSERSKELRDAMEFTNFGIHSTLATRAAQLTAGHRWSFRLPFYDMDRSNKHNTAELNTKNLNMNITISLRTAANCYTGALGDQACTVSLTVPYVERNIESVQQNIDSVLMGRIISMQYYFGCSSPKSKKIAAGETTIGVDLDSVLANKWISGFFLWMNLTANYANNYNVVTTDLDSITNIKLSKDSNAIIEYKGSDMLKYFANFDRLSSLPSSVYYFPFCERTIDFWKSTYEEPPVSYMFGNGWSLDITLSTATAAEAYFCIFPLAKQHYVVDPTWELTEIK